MSESIPAWKRAGLKQIKQVKKETYDPLKEGLKRAHESGESPKANKPAKRRKLPKTERPAPTHELDQLKYLRQYAEDKENWKFSKQKQNWILKHMFSDIDERYEGPLVAYITGLQGYSRNWVVEDAKKIINEWNELMKENPKKEDGDGAEKVIDDETNKKDEKDEDKQSKDKEDDVETGQDGGVIISEKKKKKPAKTVPTEKMALRAQRVYKELADEFLPLELLDS